MEKKQLKSVLTVALLAGLPLLAVPAAFAAKPVNLAHQPKAALHALLAAQGVTASSKTIQFEEIRRHQDFNKTVHIRVQQTYQGVPVIGGDAVVHVPRGEKKIALSHALGGAKQGRSTMNGTVYQGLQTDLAKTPANALGEAQAQKALRLMVKDYLQAEGSAATVSSQNVKKVVYIDNANQAKWAYQVRFYVPESAAHKMPAVMNYIVDAMSLNVLVKWNDVKNVTSEPVAAFSGGFGGNKKMGKLVYDGLKENLSKLSVLRDAEFGTCYLRNDEVVVSKYLSGMDDDLTPVNIFSTPYTFGCEKTDDKHNDVYWTGAMGAVNDGYSPGNDALFNGQVVKDLYKDWYGADVLVDEDGKAMKLNLVVHKPRYDNAYWNPQTATMTFGDGYSMFYPLTSLGVTAHEVSHGYTSQNSDLAYYGQSGGMNEAFSDMAAQAAEFFAYGKNSWEIGPEIFKAEGRALRYMEQPSKDCGGREPGNWCSIDHVDEYTDGLNVHFSSGIYNRAFFLMGTAEDWDVRKAFNVMVKANSDYWTSHASFKSGACGVIQAAVDYGYDTKAVYSAFETVGVDTSEC